MIESRTTAPALLALGALTWLPARWGVMTTWDTEWLGLGYTSWNRIVLVPLALLVGGSVAASRRAPGRAAAIGWAVVAAGFALSFLGVALEFVIGGGLQEGPRGLAVAGWTAYLLGYLVTALGSIVLATGLALHDRTAAAAAAVSAVALLAWPLLLATGWEALAVVNQLLVVLPWLVLAARLSRRPTAPASAPGAPAPPPTQPPSESSAPR